MVQTDPDPVNELKSENTAKPSRPYGGLKDSSAIAELKTDGNGRIILGFAAIGAFIYSCIAGWGIIWTGGLLVGIALIASGLAQKRWSEKELALAKSFSARSDEIDEMLQQQMPLQSIADKLWDQAHIPIARSLWIGGLFLLDAYDADAENGLRLSSVMALPAFENDDPDTDALIDDLSLFDSVYCYLKHSVRSWQLTGDKIKPVEGSIILHQEYLIFVPGVGLESMNLPHGSGGEILEVIGLAAEVFKESAEAHEELADSFDQPHRDALRLAAKRPQAIILPLRHIVNLSGYRLKLRFGYEKGLEITVLRDGEKTTHCFGPKKGIDGWNSALAWRLRVACAIVGLFPTCA